MQTKGVLLQEDNEDLVIVFETSLDDDIDNKASIITKLKKKET